MNLPKELTTITPVSKLLALILFVLLPVVGFILGMRHQQVISSPTIIPDFPTPTPLAIPTVDPSIIANWKTYRNSTYRFELKYPSTWVLLEANGGLTGEVAMIFANPEVISDDTGRFDEGVRSDQVDIRAEDVDGIPASDIASPQKVAEVLAEMIKDTKESWCQTNTVINGKNVLLGDIVNEKMTIAGVTATKVRCNEEATRVLGDLVRVFVPRNSVIFQVSFRTVNQEVHEPLSIESLAIFFQILSTFKFTK